MILGVRTIDLTGHGRCDITGQRFGRLVAIRLAERIDVPNSSNTISIWECVCDCGVTKRFRYGHLQSGATKSCGCLNRESPHRIKHGHARRGCITPELTAYRGARTRCNNPKSDFYYCYGGRGIEFRFKSFDEFYAELGDKPEPKRLYSVDRIKTDGHYEPGNVRWATNEQQRWNSRKGSNNISGFKGVRRHQNRWQSSITLNGKQVCLGSYDSPLVCAILYDNAARRRSGEFAHINFPSLTSLFAAVEKGGVCQS
jgi:hypothetical protein